MPRGETNRVWKSGIPAFPDPKFLAPPYQPLPPYQNRRERTAVSEPVHQNRRTRPTQRVSIGEPSRPFRVSP